MKRETWLELGGTPLGFSACSSCPLHALTVLIAWAVLTSRALLDPKEQVVQWSIDCESAFSRTLVWSLELQNCIKHRPRSHGLLCRHGPLCSHRLLCSHRSANHGPLAATCHYVATSLSTASSFMETARESHPCELKMVRHLWVDFLKTEVMGLSINILD